jgi:fumarylpyruvate hydrolase
MTDYAIPPLAPVTLPIAGSDARFPVARIFCVGRNYGAHAREMGHDPDAEPPFYFLKPGDTLLAGDAIRLPYPPRTSDLHHEVELVVALGRGGRAVSRGDAAGLIWGAGVGLDLTRRDLQAAAKEASRPWDLAKGFDGAALCGPLRPGPAPERGRIALSVNGSVRQEGDLAQMIWPVADCLAELSTYLTLRAGDLLFTGTPAGVGPLEPGDRAEAVCADLPPLAVSVEQPE